MCLAISACELAFGQTFAMESVEGMRANQVVAEAVVHKGQKGIRLTQPAGATGTNDDRLLLLPVKDFESGTIEAEISGEPGPGTAQVARTIRYAAIIRPSTSPIPAGRGLGCGKKSRKNMRATWIWHPANGPACEWKWTA